MSNLETEFPRILLFAGTTEGRELAEYLAECTCSVIACVATEYGQTLIHERPGLRVHAGRLDEQQMEEMLIQEQIDLVLDATHPYAAVVTENIVHACESLSLPYYRCLREQADGEPEYENIIYVENTEQAAEKLSEIEGNILLTTGSKELAAYQKVPGFEQRFYPRVLPLENVVSSCLALGIPAAHLIAMQGPFSEELNLAMIHQWNIRCLVTKESGKAGGFLEKINAAKRAQIPVLLIGRPHETKKGVSLEQLKQELLNQWGIRHLNDEADQSFPHFPMFVSLKGKQVQVVGAGKIASRRICSLLRFGCRIEVIAPELNQTCLQLWQENKIRWTARCWKPGDCTAQIVLAATDDHQVNREIVQECRAKNIPVNRCDCQKDCDFYFPALVEGNGLTIGLCSNGTDYTKVKQEAERLRALYRQE